LWNITKDPSLKPLNLKAKKLSPDETTVPKTFQLILGNIEQHPK
jgi:hypothetical protein